MKRVVLKAMSLVNFRGHQNFSVQFSNSTTISGDNRLGKSTIFDAFVWLLFGKDQFDRKDHEIIPIVDGKRMERVDSEVTAVLDVDGREMSIKRVLHQKWVRRRGTIEEVFDGCDTVYFMNDVPLKASEYKARIDMMIEETVFKLITNPATFLGLHWQKQREFLFQIAGTISDAEIAAKSPAFANLMEMLSGKSLAEFKKEISARKKKLQEELEKINPKIDQTAKLMPQQRDFEPIEVAINLVDEEIKAIDDQLADRAKAIRAQYERIQEVQRQINDAKLGQQNIINAKRSENVEKAFQLNQVSINAQNALSSSKRKLEDAKANLLATTNNVNGLEREVEKKGEEITRLRVEWETENAKQYLAKAGCLVCPVFGHDCGDETASSKHVEAQEIAKMSFLKAKDAKLDEITAKGKQLSSELGQLKIRLSEGEKYCDELRENLAKIKVEVEECEKAANITAIEPDTVNPVELAEWVELENKVKEMEVSISNEKPQDNSDITNRKTELVGNRDALKKTLSERDSIIQFKAEIERLKKDAGDFAQQIADIEGQEFTMAEFTKVKIDECERRINGKFDVVKFQLFDKTIDGNEFECCIPTNKLGVPISATNTAEKINAGLDIIKTMSEFYNVSAPIFCDGSESVNRYVNTEAQMIFLRVTKEPVLTITNI